MDLQESKYLGIILLVFILIILLVGILVLVGLRITWQRYYNRNREKPPRKRPDQPDVDPWEVSGKRMFSGSDNHTVFDEDGRPIGDDDLPDDGIDPNEGEEWKRGYDDEDGDE